MGITEFLAEQKRLAEAGLRYWKRGSLAMTDNRTNEPTEAQVEAAVHAAWAKSREFRGVGGQAEFAPPWEFQQVIRAALVAAAGVAPVQPSSTVSEAPDDSEADIAIADADNLAEALWAIAEKYEVPVTNNMPRWQDGSYLRHIGEFIGDIKKAAAAFPQPSSTVDEGKIADALIEELMTDLAVEEWSAEKVENTGKRLARAVVEAIGGESRGEW